MASRVREVPYFTPSWEPNRTDSMVESEGEEVREGLAERVGGRGEGR